MSDKTHIEWTDATWNPITGCSVVSAGCTHCYAMRLAGGRLRNHSSRVGLTRVTGGKSVWTGEVRLNEQWLDQPLRWKRPRRIFVCAHADLFHENVPDEWIDRVFSVMGFCDDQETGHVFQVLTKRHDRMREYMRTRAHHAWNVCRLDLSAFPPRNIWLGVSVEDQATADERIPILLDTPAAVRWISAEPLLGPLSLRWMSAWPENAPRTATNPYNGGTTDHLDGLRRLDWVVAGGESGPHARAAHPDWFRELRDQCAAAGVPFLFKQWGEWWPNCYTKEDGSRDESTMWMDRVGKKLAGRMLDGRLHDEYPNREPIAAP